MLLAIFLHYIDKMILLLIMLLKYKKKFNITSKSSKSSKWIKLKMINIEIINFNFYKLKVLLPICFVINWSISCAHFLGFSIEIQWPQLLRMTTLLCGASFFSNLAPETSQTYINVRNNNHQIKTNKWLSCNSRYT